jgi:hypothetical protein
LEAKSIEVKISFIFGKTVKVKIYFIFGRSPGAGLRAGTRPTEQK